MDSSVLEAWNAASASPFVPIVGKDSQFTVGFLLTLIGISIAGFFTLNRSILNVLLLGIPASLCLAFGVIYMFCAVGVYV